ncbi:DMT family transporter [Geminicoccus roseus]|uniref:DMT family transporter n=1 Tax=Geminicoccus roseus TaxID=404900 RepID=UPI0005545774|nr:DMT family transporter [Geminicoccus roseus]
MAGGRRMELLGVLAAMLSSGLGGASVGVTRYVVAAADPITLGVFRFGAGCLLLLPVAMLRPEPWPAPADWPGVAGLGILFFAVFPVLFNASLAFTTAARGALALSTLPLLTMLVAASLRVEPLSARKAIGVGVAMAGVAIGLLADLGQAPEGAWRGDLLMGGAALCMALYNVWSRPLIRRSGPVPFTALAMAAGAGCLAVIAAAQGGFAATLRFGPGEWAAVLYLGVLGSALTFWLWAFALQHTTPTRVAVAVTVNPLAAGLTGALILDEPMRWSLGVGIAAVLAGIGIAAGGRPAAGSATPAAVPR